MIFNGEAIFLEETFNQRLEGGEGRSHIGDFLQKRSFRAEVRSCLVCSKNKEEASVTGLERERRSSRS